VTVIPGNCVIIKEHLKNQKKRVGSWVLETGKC